MAITRAVVNKQMNNLKDNGYMASLSLWTRLLSIVTSIALQPFGEKARQAL
jgi:hypothetical protein